MADCISRGGLVHLFGSGHSVLPVQDMFPRYGAFPGFRPLMDMRLMWTNVIGSGGAKGLLWLERQCMAYTARADRRIRLRPF